MLMFLLFCALVMSPWLFGFILMKLLPVVYPKHFGESRGTPQEALDRTGDVLDDNIERVNMAREERAQRERTPKIEAKPRRQQPREEEPVTFPTVMDDQPTMAAGMVAANTQDFAQSLNAFDYSDFRPLNH